MMTRTWVLHMLAKAFGLQIKIGGWPYGARYGRAINRMAPRGNIRHGAGAPIYAGDGTDAFYL